MKVIITVLSDNVDKSKNFVRFLVGESSGFKRELENRTELVLSNGMVDIRTMHCNEAQRGHRHSKLYVDSNSPKAVEMALSMFNHNLRPIYLPNPRFSIEIKNDIEFLDFEKEMNKFL